MDDRDDTRMTTASGDPDMGSALGMAAEIFSAAQNAPVPFPEAQQTAAPETGGTGASPLPTNEELAARLAQLLPQQPAQAAPTTETPPAAIPAPSDAGSATDSGGGPGLSSLAAALPSLLQAFSGSGSFIKPEKLNLIRALKPYLSEERGSSIDRAIRMANVAQAAKSALTALGR